MLIRKYFFLFMTLLLGSACREEERDEGLPKSEFFLFEDGFETENGNLVELFPSNGSRWSTIQQDDPAGAINEISLSKAEFSEGQHSLRLFVNQSDSRLSKMDIEKNGLEMQSGDKVTIKADFYISGTQPLTNLLIMDLECCSCWDPEVVENFGLESQCPGVRLMLSGEEGYLSIERGKILGTTLRQTDLAFPRNQWVTVLWEMTLSDDQNGENKLTINGVEVINRNAMNIPNAQVFRDAFAKEGIEFNLKEPTFYERIQIGATANPTAGNIELFVDNFSIRVE